MVVKEKVVVVLLLITIILSIVSVILTFAISAPGSSDGSSVKVGNVKGLEKQFSNENGQIAFGINTPS
jgi:hypothetical protein